MRTARTSGLTSRSRRAKEPGPRAAGRCRSSAFRGQFRSAWPAKGRLACDSGRACWPGWSRSGWRAVPPPPPRHRSAVRHRRPRAPPSGLRRSPRSSPRRCPPERSSAPGRRPPSSIASYFASRFADSWSLLAPDARRQVPKAVWVGVHDGCPAATSGVTAGHQVRDRLRQHGDRDRDHHAGRSPAITRLHTCLTTPLATGVIRPRTRASTTTDLLPPTSPPRRKPACAPAGKPSERSYWSARRADKEVVDGQQRD